MTYHMDPLPYAQDALEPHLSKEVIHYHYDKRTKKYFDVANKLAEGTIYEDMKLEELLTKQSLSKIDTKLFIHASQAWNHQFYWASMTPESQSGKPSAELDRTFTESFGSYDAFVKEFSKKIDELVGSGWVWLVLKNGSLSIKSIPNAGTPLVTDGNVTPLLVCDAWEHAFELQYPAAKADYIKSFIKVINWDMVSKRFADGNK